MSLRFFIKDRGVCGSRGEKENIPSKKTNLSLNLFFYCLPVAQTDRDREKTKRKTAKERGIERQTDRESDRYREAEIHTGADTGFRPGGAIFLGTKPFNEI